MVKPETLLYLGIKAAEAGNSPIVTFREVILLSSLGGIRERITSKKGLHYIDCVEDAWLTHARRAGLIVEIDEP